MLISISKVLNCIGIDSCLRTEQFFTLIVICLVSFDYYYHQSDQNNIIAYNIPDPECTGIFNICTDVDKERLGRQSMRAIHEQMDGDKDGFFQSSESTDLKIALNQAEEHAQQESYEPSSELIDLLKRTYRTEEIAFEVKRKLTENSLMTAKEQMNKISKMQKGVFHALRIAHTNCIVNVKERLTEIHDEYVEREER
ncbi:unnamed protein product [Rotaria socialis]|uniref:STIM1/2 Orai1-activating region domain-containing protein n=1 Tax=Rotaria socialis TaxID=392032 RepID=A0A818DAX9_9BILA|nr:unnamed protein product [Rotaria socialis]